MKKKYIIVIFVFLFLFVNCKQEIKTPNGSLSNTTWTRPDSEYSSMTEELEFADSYLSAKLNWGGNSGGGNFLTYVSGSKLYLNTWGKTTPTTSSYDSVYSFIVDKTTLELTHLGGDKINDLAGTYTKK